MIVWQRRALYWIIWRVENMQQYYTVVYGVKEGIALGILYSGCIWLPTEAIVYMLYTPFYSVHWFLFLSHMLLISFFSAFTFHSILYRIGYLDHLAFSVYAHVAEARIEGG
jgi:hypothetical protein